MRLNDQASKSAKISLTPLIDVVFLLLIFFMLASTFWKFTSIPVSGAQGGSAASTVNEIMIIRVLGGEDGELSINGVEATTSNFMDHVNDMVAKGMTKAVVRPGAEAKVQDLVSVLEQVRSSSLKSVVVVE